MDIVTVHMGGDISLFAGRDSYLAKMTEIAFSLTTERLFEIADAFRKAYEQKSNNLELVFRSVIIGIICRQSILSDLIKKVELLETEVATLRKSPSNVVPENTAHETYQAVEEVTSPVNTSVANSAIAAPPAEQNSAKTTLPDEEIANDLAQLGFSYIDEDPFEESVPASVREEKKTEHSAPAEDNIFGDFARFFQF